MSSGPAGHALLLRASKESVKSNKPLWRRHAAHILERDARPRQKFRYPKNRASENATPQNRSNENATPQNRSNRNPYPKQEDPRLIYLGRVHTGLDPFGTGTKLVRINLVLTRDLVDPKRI